MPFENRRNSLIHLTTAALIAACSLNVSAQQQAASQRSLMLEQHSNREVSGIAEPLRKLAQSFLNDAGSPQSPASNMDVRVVQGYRTYEQQNQLYAQGRTTPGPRVTNAPGGFSYHNFGLAFDVGLFQRPALEYLRDSPVYDALGNVGKLRGLSWGGDWKSFRDRPHFQWRTNRSLNELRNLKNSCGADCRFIDAKDEGWNYLKPEDKKSYYDNH